MLKKHLTIYTISSIILTKRLICFQGRGLLGKRRGGEEGKGVFRANEEIQPKFDILKKEEKKLHVHPLTS
jgi:hypothetical protein